jgi:acetoin utilization protein AcuB
MKVKEWMSPDPVTVAPYVTVTKARQLFESHRFRHLPVLDGNRVIGMVSDRDVGINHAALIAAVRARDVEGLIDDERTVESVMSAPVHVVDVDASVSEAARLLLSRRISALPVVDEDRALVGIITSVDCLLATLELTRTRHATDRI